MSLIGTKFIGSARGYGYSSGSSGSGSYVSGSYTFPTPAYDGQLQYWTAPTGVTKLLTAAGKGGEPYNYDWNTGGAYGYIVNCFYNYGGPTNTTPITTSISGLSLYSNQNAVLNDLWVESQNLITPLAASITSGGGGTNVDNSVKITTLSYIEMFVNTGGDGKIYKKTITYTPAADIWYYVNGTPTPYWSRTFSGDINPQGSNIGIVDYAQNIATWDAYLASQVYYETITYSNIYHKEYYSGTSTTGFSKTFPGGTAGSPYTSAIAAPTTTFTNNFRYAVPA